MMKGIHIIKGRHPIAGRGAWKRYSAAFLSVVAATFVHLLAEEYLGHRLSPYIFYYPAVIFAAWYGGFGAGTLSTFLSVALGTLLFVPPYYSFALENSEDFFPVILFLFVSLIICSLIENLYRSMMRQDQIAGQLLQSQRRLSSILESMQGCFFSLDEEGRFRHINEESRDYLPGPRENFYGKSVWEAFPAWRGGDFEERLRDVVERKEPVEFEFQDESQGKWYEIHISPSSEGTSVHFHDITPRKEAENALSESESRFRLVADQAPVMVWMSGLDALCFYFNETWLKFRGKTMDEEQGNGWMEGIFPDDRPFCVDAYLKAFHTREPFSLEYRIQRADGQFRWVLNNGKPRFAADKKFLGYIGSAIDITERKETESRQFVERRITQILAEEAIQDQAFAKILQEICEVLGWEVGAYWTIDMDSQQLRCRQVWAKQGWEGKEFVAETRRMAFPPGGGLPGRIWSFGKAFWIQDLPQDTNFSRSGEAEKAGLRSGVGFPIRSRDDMLGVMEFFSEACREPDANLIQTFESLGSEIGQYLERKKIEEALKSAYDDMERRVEHRTSQLARINEALTQEILERRKVEKEVLEISEKEQRRLGAMIHDDLCQSLTGIMILTKVLNQKMERPHSEEAAREFGKELKKIGDLLNQSITQAREMARGFYPVELHADSLMIALRDLAGRTETLYGVPCRFVCPQPILFEDNDQASHLYRIVQEAVHNAVKHGAARQIEVSLLQDRGSVTLTVEDDGKGLARDPGQASGIGLHIMKYRARMIDATLEIRQGPSGGTQLTCSFNHPVRIVASAN